MNPLFSIILPTYNRAYVVWRAILSVLAQTEARWELLVIDDGSTDPTSRVMEEFRDPRIRFFSTPRGGPAAARNYGARLARAPHLAYLDSDNTWHADFLSTMRLEIERHADGVLWYCGQHTSIWRRSETGTWQLEQMTIETRDQYSVEEVLDFKGADTNCIVHTAGVLAEVGGWDEECLWGEDWDFYARCVLRYPRNVHWVPRVLVEYRQVYGADVDGVCATLVQNPARNRAAWRYVIEKWRAQPGFAATAERLTKKHLREPPEGS